MFELNQLYNMDCMTAMREIPDKFFELAICDPPYGIGIDGQKLNINKKNPKHTRKEHTRKNSRGQEKKESASYITIEEAAGQKERTPLQRCPV